MAKPQNSTHQERCFAEENHAYISCLMGRPKSLNSWCLYDRQKAFDACVQRTNAEAQTQKGVHSTKPHSSTHSRPAGSQ
jgi:hypothetical protein